MATFGVLKVRNPRAVRDDERTLNLTFSSRREMWEVEKTLKEEGFEVEDSFWGYALFDRGSHDACMDTVRVFCRK